MLRRARPYVSGLWTSRAVGPHFPRRGDLILLISYPQCGSIPTRTTQKGQRIESLQISSPGWRARFLIIVSLNTASIDIYKDIENFVRRYRTSVLRHMEKPGRRTAVSPQKGISSWFRPTFSEVVTQKGQSRMGIVANLLSGLATTTSYNRFFQRSLYRRPRGIRQQGVHYFVQRCCPTFYGPGLAYLSIRINRVGGPQFPQRRDLILVTFYLPGGSTPARACQERQGAESSQISYPDQRSCCLIFVSLKVIFVNIEDGFGNTDITILY